MDPKLHEQWMYDDPTKGDQGVLLSNNIHKLCREKLLIAEGYSEQNLRPASYTLCIGDEYIDSDGKRCRLSEKDESFVFQKNSIIFVSTNEKLLIPFYIIARFNLRVNWVYDGVLLGTGPQVDPGFSGFLSCPLYNLTNVDITIRRGDKFATIDFEKTTSLLADLSWEDKKKKIDDAKDKDLAVIGEEKYSFYKTPSMAQLQHRKSHNIVSSLFEMREEVRTWRNLGIGALIAFFGLTLSLLAFGANLYRQDTDLSRQNTDLTRQLVESKNDVRESNERIANSEKRIDQLESSNKQSQARRHVASSTPARKDSH